MSLQLQRGHGGKQIYRRVADWLYAQRGITENSLTLSVNIVWTLFCRAKFPRANILCFDRSYETTGSGKTGCNVMRAINKNNSWWSAHDLQEIISFMRRRYNVDKCAFYELKKLKNSLLVTKNSSLKMRHGFFDKISLNKTYTKHGKSETSLNIFSSWHWNKLNTKESHFQTTCPPLSNSFCYK